MNKNSLDYAMGIIEKYQRKAPVNIFGIASELNLKIFKGASSPQISGKIVKDSVYDKEQTFSIYVNEDHASSRQRFTIAHEIAHFILHRDKIGDGIVDDAMYRSGLKSSEETEANKLAAQILMPWSLINLHLNETSTVQILAKLFEVSESAMAIRLGIPC